MSKQIKAKSKQVETRARKDMVRFRVSPEEAKMLADLCRAAGEKLSPVIRRLIRDAHKKLAD